MAVLVSILPCKDWSERADPSKLGAQSDLVTAPASVVFPPLLKMGRISRVPCWWSGEGVGARWLPFCRGELGTGFGPPTCPCSGTAPKMEPGLAGGHGRATTGGGTHQTFPRVELCFSWAHNWQASVPSVGPALLQTCLKAHLHCRRRYWVGAGRCTHLTQGHHCRHPVSLPCTS